ncbi:hypothetical protein Pmu_01700 [Pasteurella multocida 36950]|nr:hypothetical protein Pmu_01700 [Pasteurella multocida 36950]
MILCHKSKKENRKIFNQQENTKLFKVKQKTHFLNRKINMHFFSPINHFFQNNR